MVVARSRLVQQPVGAVAVVASRRLVVVASERPVVVANAIINARKYY